MSLSFQQVRNELDRLSGFVHSTFNGTDLAYFIKGLRNIYSNYENMEEVLTSGDESRRIFKRRFISFHVLFSFSSALHEK